MSKKNATEIRNEKTKKLRDEGKNLDANRFYTTNKIDDLKNKSNLTLIPSFLLGAQEENLRKTLLNLIKTLPY